MYALDSRLSGPQGQSGCCGTQKKYAGYGEMYIALCLPNYAGSHTMKFSRM
jgi:hypothetical protein